MKVFAILLLLASTLIAIMSVIAGFGVRSEWWSYTVGFQFLRSAVVSAALCGLLAIAGAIIGTFRNTDVLKQLLPALALCAAVVAVPYLRVSEFGKVKTFGEATTSYESLPTFVQLADMRAATVETPRKFSLKEAQAAQEEYFPNLASLELDTPIAQLTIRTANLLQDMGLDVAMREGTSDRVEATDTSFWFGFKDDVVVVFESTVDGATRVDVRSSARVGKFDGGANARRVVAILSALAR